jgi:hypothetical protein
VLKGGVLANLAVASFAHLVQVIRHGLKKIQYRPGLIEGCLAGTGLILEPAPALNLDERSGLALDQAGQAPSLSTDGPTLIPHGAIEVLRPPGGLLVERRALSQ